MTWYKDLSRYEYGNPSIRPTCDAINVGWLEPGHHFETGATPPEVVDAIWDFCAISVSEYRGFFSCPFCSNASMNVSEHRGIKRRLGSAEIRVYGPGDLVFASPNLIFHYVTTHSYLPPASFIAALGTSPRPPAPEYLARLRESGHFWVSTPVYDPNPPRFKYIKTERGFERVPVADEPKKDE